MSRSIFILILMLGISQLFAQGWLAPHYDLSSSIKSISSLEGGYLMLGGAAPNGVSIRKVDEDGQTVWTTPAPVGILGIDVLQNPTDSTYLLVYQNANQDSTLYWLQLSAQGQGMGTDSIVLGQVSTRPIGFPNRGIGIHLTSDQHILVGSNYHRAADSTCHMALAKATLSGQVLWERYYLNTSPANVAGAMEVFERGPGQYWMVGGIANGYAIGNTSNAGQGDVYVIETDTAGNEQWRRQHNVQAFDEIEGARLTQDGGLLAVGQYKAFGPNQIGFALKLDASGNQEWIWTSSTTIAGFGTAITSGVENPNGTFTLTGNMNYPTGSIAVIKLSSTGTLLWERGLSTGLNNDRGREIFLDQPGSATSHVIRGDNAQGPFWMGIDSMGNLYSNKIIGQYRLDDNNNCLTESTERPGAGVVITAVQGSRTFYGTTDSTGQYEIELDSGQYTVSARTLSPYWQLCQPSQTTLLRPALDVDTVDFALQAIDSCVHMQVDLSAPFIRRCFNSGYTVQYTNLGTIDATNSYVEVTLDPYLTYVSSTIPLVSQVGAVHRFDLGTVPSLQQGSFDVVVAVDCDSTALGQVHCSEAHIYPDTICTSSLWSGAIIEASSTCTPDSIQFTLLNTGAAMSLPQFYNIVEEHVMLRQAPFQLGSGSSQTITVPRRHGRVYRIEAAQEAGFPAQLGDPIAISNQVACGVPPLLFQPDILGQFYQGNMSSNIAVDCQPNIGAYDPNDKYAQPVGYGPNHFIENNIAINYRIRFQNTGTDTAFTVVILDTIDADLDPSTIQMGASSHPYTWSLSGTGVLEIRFDNIMLPDSNVNEPLSHGFVKFQIEQQPNNPDSTRLTNRAAIYFDFNPPIITNEVFHTIGRDFVERFVGINEPLLEDIDVKLYPNPFRQTATIEIQGEVFDQLQVHIYSVDGQLLKTYQGSGNQLQLERSNLPTGIYFYQLIGDDQLISRGKFIVK